MNIQYRVFFERQVILLFTLSMWHYSFATQTVTYGYNFGTVYIDITNGDGTDAETYGYYEFITLYRDLSSDVSIPIKIQCTPSITSSEKCSLYTLGYGQFSTMNAQGEKTELQGVLIHAYDNHFDVIKLLKLSHWGLSNVKQIKSSQNIFHFDSKCFNPSSIKTIDTSEVNKIVNKPDSIVSKLLNKRVFKRGEQKFEGKLGYYYQEGKFHFYKSQFFYDSWNNHSKPNIAEDSSVKDILVVDQIANIMGDHNLGYLVFYKAYQFYYIPRSQDTVIGPFEIPRNYDERIPMYDFYYETEGIKRISFKMDGTGKTTKFVFLPDQSVLISNYDSLENEMIHSVIKKELSEPEIRKSLGVIPTLFTLATLLLCCSLLFVLRKLFSAT